MGLRTLLIAYKYVKEDFYLSWVEKYKEASSSNVNRDQLMAKCAELIETDFLLAGCSAIEDKLQEDVGPTIRDIRRAGIKVWVLTGDKVETAINIGQSCQLLSKEQNWLALRADGLQALRKEINDMIAKQKVSARKNAIIVDGFQLTLIQSSKELTAEFVDLCTSDKAEVVLVCRVSP